LLFISTRLESTYFPHLLRVGGMAMLWLYLLLMPLILLGGLLAKRRWATRSRNVRGSSPIRRPLHIEALTERIVPSWLPLTVPNSLGGVEAQVRTLPSPSESVAAPAAGEASSGLFGVTIRAPGVEIEAFGADAQSVQLLLLSAAGLLGAPRLADEQEEKRKK